MNEPKDICDFASELSSKEKILARIRPIEIPRPTTEVEIVEAAAAVTPTQSIPVPDLVYYHSLSRTYIFPAHGGGYTALALPDVLSHLRALGVSQEEANMKLAEARHYRTVDSIRPIAGYQPGIVQQRDKRVLVTTGPTLVEPRPGAWDTIQALIESPLGREQAFYVYALLKLAFEGLIGGGRKKFPALFIGGPPQCGKSLIQDLVITPLLGGRAADPYDHFRGEDRNNGLLAACEHLAMADKQGLTGRAARVRLGKGIKLWVANEWIDMEGKYEKRLALNPFRFISMSFNLGDDDISALPSIDPSMSDKVIFLKAEACEMPMPTSTDAEFAALEAQIASELPAFAWWLVNEMAIPADKADRRYGVRGYMNPFFERARYEDSDERQLRDLMLLVLPLPCWEGNAGDLWRKILSHDDTKFQAGKLPWGDRVVGRLLRELQKKHPESIRYQASNWRKPWEIMTELLADEAGRGEAQEAE